MTAAEIRDREVRAFVRTTFGPRGTLRLHRAALGADVLRAPLNLFLAPVFLLTRLIAFLLRRFGAVRAGDWLAGRRILLATSVSRRVAARVSDLLERLDVAGAGVGASAARRARAVEDYVGVRNAVAEIVTTLFVLLTGYLLFHVVTPGMMSLAGPVAEMRAQAGAIRDFPLGSGLGRLFYGVVPVALPLWSVVATGVVLAGLGALVTAFAGLVADPVQVLIGTHRRRLMRMLNRLDRAEAEGLAREHVLARAGDMSDAVMTLWRGLRG